MKFEDVKIIFDTNDKALRKLEQSANSDSLEPDVLQRLGCLMDSGDSLPSTIPLAKRRKSACNSPEVPSDRQCQLDEWFAGSASSKQP